MKDAILNVILHVSIFKQGFQAHLMKHVNFINEDIVLLFSYLCRLRRCHHCRLCSS
jgi:hypothetical protein